MFIDCRTWTLLFCLAIAGCTHGQLTPIDPPRVTTLAHPTAQLPLELDAQGRPVVLGQINGNGPYRFAIDWGANAFMISESLAEALALSVDNVSFDNGQQIKAAAIGSLQLGHVKFEQLSAGIAGFLDTPALNLDGVLGFHLFTDLLMTFDFPGQTLRFERGALPAANGQTILALVAPDWGPFAGRLEGARPHVNIQLGDYAAAATLDTQGASWLSIPDTTIAQFNLLSGPVDAEGWGPTMGQMAIQMARVDADLQIGGITVTKPTVFFRNRPSIVLGAPFLNQFAITLDQKHRRVRFDGAPPHDIEVPPAPWETAVANGERPDNDRSEGRALEQYAGTYGARTVSVDRGRLYLQRNDVTGGETGDGRRIAAPRLLMVSLTGDEFALERIPSAKIRFGRDATGKVMEMQVLNPAGQWETSRRDRE